MPVSNAELAKAGRDHGLALREVFDHIFAVLEEVDLLAVIAGQNPRMTRPGILKSIAQTKGLDAGIRRRFETASLELSEGRQTFSKLPRPRQDLIRAITAQLRGCRNQAELKQQLTLVERRAKGDEQLLDGVRLGRAFLAEAADTAYAPKQPIIKVFASKGLGEVASEDVAAGVGSLGAGIPPQGAVGIGLGASAASAILEIGKELSGANDVELLEDVIKNLPA